MRWHYRKNDMGDRVYYRYFGDYGYELTIAYSSWARKSSIVSVEIKLTDPILEPILVTKVYGHNLREALCLAWGQFTVWLG